MKKHRFPFLAFLWLALALALFPILRAQETPTPATPTTAPTPATPETPPTPTDDEDEDAGEGKITEELATSKAKVDAKLRRAEEKLRALGVEVEVDQKAKRKTRPHSNRPRVDLGIATTGRELVVFNRDARVHKGETAEAVVAIGGNAQVDGDSRDAVVTVFGSSEVNGKVGDAVVAVMGSTRVNGHVGDAVVAVMGNVTLGPDAVVEGEVVSVGGSITRDPKSIVKGGIQEIAFMDKFPEMTGLKTWISKCGFWGRMLWFGPHLGWAWMMAGAFLMFYALLALVFPRGIEKTAEVLEQRPGATFLTMLLTVLLTPVLFVLLFVTVLGIAVVPFLVIGAFFATLFGKAALFAWLGRRIFKAGGEGMVSHPAFAVIVGGLIVMLLYTIPVFGMVLYKFIGLLGLAMVVHRLILSMQREKPKAPPAAPIIPPAMGAISAAVSASMPSGVAGEMNADGSPAGSAAAPLAPPPVIISAATLPRAGFWPRFLAALLDCIMVGMVFVMLEGMFRWFHFGGSFPFWFAVYNVVMWATKGTTIGGIVCGLKVVRLDDRPLDWSVSIIRGLTAFLSLGVAGLGFIWVAFDDEKQSWHDKIAGTTIVRVPKGTSLL